MGLEIDYDHLWGNNKIIDYKVWPTWGLMRERFTNGGNFLEIGSGNRPRIPIAGSHFIDTSPVAVGNLNKLGAHAQVGSAERLPYADNLFDVICAFEIIEHVRDDREVIKEVSRVLKGGGRFFFSVPLGMKFWSSWDELAGHLRRYEPRQLKETLENYGFVVEKFIPGKNITVLQRYLWLGKGATVIYRHFPKPFIFLEHHLVTAVVKLETKLGAFRGLKWQSGDFANLEKGKTSVILLCRKN